MFYHRVAVLEISVRCISNLCFIWYFDSLAFLMIQFVLLLGGFESQPVSVPLLFLENI